MKSSRPVVALALATALLNAGCMGSFALTKRLYDFNNTITGNKILNNVIFWALLILPVYNICIVVDGVILNLIEFWTGSNPLAIGEIEKLDDGSLRLARDGSVYEAKALDENRVQVTQDGVVIGTLEVTADGALVVRGPDGAEGAVISADERAAMAPVLAGLAQ
jgi:Domain of unknown function (DUF3332)